MRITIDIDGRVTEPVSGATPTVATPVTETADGGAAPAVSPSGATANTSAEDTGGPPAWLFEAVGQAAAAEGLAPAAGADTEDAGAGPAKP